ncbi:MAG: hypothetical protein ACRC14_13565 [Paracoccaceae bacterium]
MGLIGHNGGPSVEGGASWRRHCWTSARARLLPTLPIEVVRLRVRRAQELGLDYKTYAGVRASTGHDVVAFLFSSNALRVTAKRPDMADERAAKVAAIAACNRIALAVAPLDARILLQANPELDQAHPAPFALARFREITTSLRDALGKLPADRVILVGDMALERDWCTAGRLAAYLPADRYFAS